MIPQFETDRLILRVVTSADAPSYQKHFANWEIIRNLSKAVPWPYPEGGTLWYIEHDILPSLEKNRWHWGLFLKSKPSEMIGAIDLFKNELPFNRGFWLAQEHWNQGLMTEAVAPVTKFAFEVLGFEKLVFANALGNVRSRRIKEKTGAKFIRIIPYEHHDPALQESELWELSREDWRAQTGRN